ncbi:MAG TPA: hypothetical protein VGG05_03455 [Pseudonocardiaceae bacterium]|jgi:hypothetical protein
MTDWPLDRVEALLAPVAALPRAADLTDLAATWPNKFLPTLLSARAAVAPLAADESAALDRSRHRIGRSDRMLRSICAAHPSVWALKGGATRMLYPAHLVRQQDDLDLVADDVATLWDVTASLLAADWEVDAVWARRSPRRSGPEITVVLTQDRGDPMPDRIEVTTDPLEGDHWSVASRRLDLTATDSASLALLLLVEEGVGRPFGARDLLDAALLLDHLADRSAADAVIDLVERHGVAVEWNRLAEALRANPAVRRASVPEPRAVHRPGTRPSVRSARHPVWWCALRAAKRIRDREGVAPLADRLLTRLQGTLGARRVYESGLAMFGIPMPDEQPVAQQRFEFAGPLGMLSTPAGRFVLSAGGGVPESWLPPIVEARSAG